MEYNFERPTLDLNDEKQELETVFDEPTRTQRFVHYLIDMITGYALSALAGVALALILGAMGSYALFDDNETVAENLLFRLIAMLCFAAYFFFMEYFNNGKTFGKMATGSKVVREDGEKPTASQLLGRAFSRFVPFEPFSIFFSDDNRMWHDKWSKTKVVKERK